MKVFLCACVCVLRDANTFGLGTVFVSAFCEWHIVVEDTLRQLFVGRDVIAEDLHSTVVGCVSVRKKWMGLLFSSQVRRGF